MEKIKDVLEKAAARIGCPPGDNADADLYHEILAALSALEGSKPKELTDIGIVEAANKLFSERHLNSLARESHPTLRRAQLRGMVECATLAKNLIDGYLSPQPSEELAASLPVSEGLQARIDRANRLLIQQKEQKPKEHDASFDLLWIKLMDALKKRGIAPSNANELFVLIGDLRKSSNSHEVQPKEQGAEPYAWTVSGTRQMYFGEYAESDARMEAKKIGGTAVAFPLFRQEQGAEPVPTAREKAMEEAECTFYRDGHRIVQRLRGRDEFGDPQVTEHYMPIEAARAMLDELAAALSALEGSKPKELTDDAPFKAFESEHYKGSFGVRGPHYSVAGLVNMSAAEWLADKMNWAFRLGRDGGYLSPQPKEHGAEPVAWMTEDGKEFVENWVREEWVKDNGPTAQFFIPRYPTPLYRHPQPLPAPSAREKAMEVAGDAMDELLDGPWHIYDENREKAIAVWRAAKQTK